MIPSLPPKVFPPDTLEDLIFDMWQDCINSAASYDDVPMDAVQKLIADTRRIATDAGWPATYTHDFCKALADLLKRATLGHPTTKKIIRLLEIETEFN